MMTACKSLLIITHVTHYFFEGRLYAYGPYVREIDVWAGLFSEVAIAAPLICTHPPDDSLFFSKANITPNNIDFPRGSGIRVRLTQLVALPFAVWSLCRLMRKYDAVHVRCPGSLGLLGAVLAPLFAKRMVAKYAGQWSHYPGESVSFRIQRAILGSHWWRGPVTVYTCRQDDESHVVSFYSTALSQEQMNRARASALNNIHGKCCQRILFVGRLSADKNVDVLLEALELLPASSAQWQCDIVGHGNQISALIALAKSKGLGARVRFLGGLPFNEVLAAYERSDILVLVSNTEGWPKAILEGMAFGLICIGADRGLVPHILSEGRGFIVPPRDHKALAELLALIISNPQQYRAVAAAAGEWASSYSLESLQAFMRQLLEREWKVALLGNPSER
jgi:glycosyltransferase involved in cell wall biosynthesis